MYRPHYYTQLNQHFKNLTFALNSTKKSKCLLRSVARINSMTRNLNLLSSALSNEERKLNSGLETKRFHDDAAWWFSSTERSLYRRAYSGRERMKYMSTVTADNKDFAQTCIRHDQGNLKGNPLWWPSCPHIRRWVIVPPYYFVAKPTK